MADGSDAGVLVLAWLLWVGLLALLELLSLSRPSEAPRTEAVALERNERGRIVGVITRR